MNLKRIGNKIYDGLYYFWYGYRRASATEPLFKFSFPGEIPIKVDNQLPEYLKPKPKSLKANYTVQTGTEFCKKLQEGLQCGVLNKVVLDFQTLNLDLPITGKVWVYNVSKLTHEVDTPTLGRVRIPGNTTRKRHSLWTSFPNLVRTPCQTFGDNGEILVTTRVIDGKRYAMDLINPDNLGLDQDFKSHLGYSTSIGRNLGVRGVFWSEHNPPKKAEVDAAILRLETFYKDLLERAEIMYQAAQFRPERVKQIMEEKKVSLEDAVRTLRVSAMELTPEHHAAAEWFKIPTPWHPVLGGKHV